MNYYIFLSVRASLSVQVLVKKNIFLIKKGASAVAVIASFKAIS